MRDADDPTLGDVVARARTHRKTVRVCNFSGGPADLAAIESHLEPHDVDFEVVPEAPDRPSDVVDLVSRGRVEATSPVEEVLGHVRTWEESMAEGLAREPPAVFVHLDDTFFESFDKRRMVMASRIVEFRARNVGSGSLHAGFQDLSKLGHQRRTYRNLVRSGVEVHVYGAAAPAVTDGLGVHVHEHAGDEVRAHWWVAFDGDGRDEDKVLLLAQEREPDRFYGFWTYEPDAVDATVARSEQLAREASAGGVPTRAPRSP